MKCSIDYVEDEYGVASTNVIGTVIKLKPKFVSMRLNDGTTVNIKNADAAIVNINI